MHPIADGQCRESLEAITELIAHEVARTPTTKTSAITMAARVFFLQQRDNATTRHHATSSRVLATSNRVKFTFDLKKIYPTLTKATWMPCGVCVADFGATSCRGDHK